MGKDLSFAVVLSGCGFKDGTEIHEAVCTLLALSRAGVRYQCFAPDAPQHHVTNHLTGQAVNETRNMLVESARIARGKIFPLAQFDAAKFDALIFPGGFGAATNLCTFALKGPDCQVHPDVQKAVEATAGLKKPIGALCIAPVILAKVLGQIKVTVGDDRDVNAALAKLETKTQDTTHGEVVVDEKNKIVTTPCYMLEASVAQIFDGAANLVKAVVRMCS